MINRLRDALNSKYGNQIKIIFFISGYNAIVLSSSIPILLGISNLIPYTHTANDLQCDLFYTSFLFYCLVAICCLFIGLIIAVVHTFFINRYTSLHYEIHKAKSNIKNISFMFLCLFISSIINFIIKGLVTDLVYKLLAFYITQNIVYYLLLKVKLFGYNIVRRSKTLSA
jgi:hypothetical protein